MDNAEVQALLDAVRRRLWRAQFIAAVRLASWGSVAVMLLAVAVQVAARPLPSGVVVPVLAVTWASMMAWAGTRRPADRACALWADRHLGGASAFTTLLETASAARGDANPQAVRCLEQWALARVPHGLRLLAGRHEPAQLSRPLLSMAICAALASVVLALPETAPSPQPSPAASSPPGAVERPAPDAGPELAADRVGEIASALRAARSADEPEPRLAAQTTAAGRVGSADGTGSAMARAGAMRGQAQAGASQAPVGHAADATPSTGATQVSGAGSGRDAGNSRDERAEFGVSRLPPGTISVQRSAPEARHPSTDRRADMERLAAYDDELSMHGAAAAGAVLAPAAATPPAATESTQLTATEASYVQAWMKSSGQGR